MKEELYWGKFTWALFHTCAAKINVEQEIPNLITMIELVCANLPCPDCRLHAKTYLQKNPIRKIVNNKDSLIKYLHEFHNVVNLRTRKRTYNINILEQYKNYDLKLIINTWVKYFRIFHISPYTIKEHSNREKIKNQVHKYINDNIHKFM
tara:strand:- start:3759 stop:4208 length:450 start_codon:yes stop_codon:yes gene_type:complete